MKRKNLSAVLCAGLLCAVCMPFSSCATYLDIFEEDYYEWYSEDGSCGFTSTLDDFGAFGYFKVNGKTVRAYYSASFDASIFITFPYSEDLNLVTESDGLSYDTSNGECHGKMSGRHDGDVFHVINMQVGLTPLGSFDLYRRKMGPSEIDARDYSGCTWKADDGCLTITDGMCGIDEYTATAERDGKSISVYFHWLDGRRFEICDKLLYEEGREVLASGTYSNVGLELLLTFETDTVFHFEETVALSGAER